MSAEHAPDASNDQHYMEPVTLRQINEAWERTIIPAIQEHSIPVATILQRAQPTSFRNDILRVQFPPGSEFHCKVVSDHRNLVLLEGVLGSLFGCSVSVRTYVDRSRQPAVRKPKSDYASYLKSDHWQHMRQLAFDYYGGSCVMCGVREHLNVHHRTYERKGKELLSDLALLCRDCHAKFHDKMAT